MGESLPPSWPGFDDNKWYCILSAVYLDATPAIDCTQTYQGCVTCCRLGSMINQWIAGDRECNTFSDLCVPGTGSAERLMNAVGPYDTQAQCLAAC